MAQQVGEGGEMAAGEQHMVLPFRPVPHDVDVWLAALALSTKVSWPDPEPGPPPSPPK